MSRVSDYDVDENFPNEAAFWWHRADQAVKSKRGKQALRDLRDALMALPEHRLVSGALSTMSDEIGFISSEWRRERVNEIIATEGQGVCAVGAYIWHQKVKAGADPDEAMRSLPLLDDEAYDVNATAVAGEASGLTYTLAYVLAERNDEAFQSCSPEERWEGFVSWIDQKLEAAT